MLTKNSGTQYKSGESTRTLQLQNKKSPVIWGFFLLSYSMIVEMPKTLEDFKKVRETILELMANPYCDQFMFLSLSEKLDKTDAKIEELSKQ
jgi:hypothetical protein